MVVFAGCAKKPKRPAPSDTVLGQNGAAGLNPNDAGNLGDASAANLQNRDPNAVIDDGHTIRNLLKPVYFKYNESAISPEERAKLNEAKDYLEKNPQYRLLLEGHCDWRGTAEYNVGLGDRRANAAKKYIQPLGVAATKLETLSKGDLDAKENASEDEMAKDRKVELVVLKN
jgi:peptidoglycan-associated lipoprotein